LASIILLPTYGRFWQQLLCACEVQLCELECGVAFIERGNAVVQHGHPVIDILHGVSQLRELAPGLCFKATNRSRGSQQIRLCDPDGRSFFGDRNFIRLPVQLGENVSLVDTVVIVDKNPGYLAAYASSNERDMSVHIGVVSRDSVESQFDPGDAVFPDGRQHQSGRHSDS
jgi:hypothetical protein